MHPINSLLPIIEKDGLNVNDNDNWQAIVDCLLELDKEHDVVDARIIGRCIRLMETRLNMKYICNAEKLSHFTASIIRIYLTKRVSIPMKIKTLTLLTRLLKYRKYGLNIEIAWKPFWDEAFGICSRSSKDKSIACEVLNSRLFESLIHFLHEARCYFNAEDAVAVLNEGMSNLQDLRNPLCFFGVELLVLCLPTKYAHYDEVVPKWVELLSSINDNDAWDCCWLTLLCRARKYTVDFNWSSIMPQIYVKVKELLQFPVSNGKGHRTNGYPNTFPPYIAALRVSPMDYRKSALKKISKLLYMSCCTGEIVTASPCTITPPGPAKDIPVVGMNTPAQVHVGARALIEFLQFNRTYFYPSNVGHWTADVGYLMLSLTTEMGQHLGQSLLRSSHFRDALSHPSEAVDLNTRDCHTMPVLHTTTIRFLCGALTSLVLEGLYGKSQFMIQACHFCLRNICAIDSSLGVIIMPFLLSALHPDAVNRSHMAPASMMAIGHIFKPLLYPEPVVLPYMEELLSLSLAGIDANDTQKTFTTLAMYNSIFSWITPSSVQADLTDDLLSSQPHSTEPGQTIVPPPYLTLLEGGDNIQGNNGGVHQSHFHNFVAPVIATWAPKFVEKIFTLLDAKEKLQQGSGVKQESQLVPYIEEAFFVVVSTLSDNIRLSVLQMVIEFTSTSNASNAAKELGKLFESLIAVQPTLLTPALDGLLDRDMITSSCSADKLALRIRLVGACIRRAGGERIQSHMDRIQFCLKDEFKHHSEKSVRKAVCKLLKDLLKGLSSFYLSIPETKSAFSIGALGNPNYAENLEVSWHIPSTSSSAAAVSLLRTHTCAAMNDVEASLGEGMLARHQESDNGQDSQPLKRVEERIVTLLHIVRRSVRGCAELFGDESSPETEIIADLDDTSDESNYSERVQQRLVDTGRRKVLESMSDTDRDFLQSFRCNVVKFLNRIHRSIDLCGTSTSLAIDEKESCTAASAFANNSSIRSVWVKILKVATLQRMAVLKNIDQVKKWFSVSKRMSKSATVQYLERKLKRLQYIGVQFAACDDTTWMQSIGSVEYWLGHDLAPRAVSDRAWIQHIIRQKELSFMATFQEQQKLGLKSPYVVALYNHVELCGHEYDAIRSKSQKIFREVSSRFGFSIEKVVRMLLARISTPGTSFASVSGALSILSLDLVMKRIAAKWALCRQFLKCVRSFPLMLASITEADKCEKLSNKLSSVFVKYLSHWHHMPLRPWIGEAKSPATEMLISFLADFGVRNGEDHSVNGTVGIDSNASNSGSGIRHHMLLASTILHLIGHEDIALPLGVWEWCLTTISSAHGQPIQMVALSALTKLSFLQYGERSNLDPGVGTAIRSTLSGEACVEFLHGISHHRSGNASQGNAQWSKGIDSMLRNSDYVRNVLSRIDTVGGEIQTFSGVFRNTNAALIMQLAYTLFPAGDIDTKVLLSVLAASKDIPSSNEEETRAANATRAEVFSGICRFLLSAEKSGCPGSKTASVWSEVVNFFADNVQRVSMDYCNDWADATVFAFASFPNSPTNPICAHIISNVSSMMTSDRSGEDPAEMINAVNSAGSGFAKHAKNILLARALLLTDILAVSSPYPPSTSMVMDKPASRVSDIGCAILKVFRDSCSSNRHVFASPYLVLRVEVSKLLAKLTECDNATVDMDGVATKVLVDCSRPYTQKGTPVGTETTDALNDSSDVIAPQEEADDKWKLSCDTACRWLGVLLETTMVSRYDRITCVLLNAAIEGCGHSEVEFSKSCHRMCLQTAQTVKYGIRTCRPDNDSGSDCLFGILTAFLSHASHSSIHVRETVILCLGILLSNNYPVMTVPEKKMCKDAFAEGFHDPKPEVQVLSVAAMTTYLCTKTIDDLNALAASYIKNSDILAARERKKRKQNKEGGSNDKPEKIYVSTIKMSACMILLFPYDLPEYMPALLTSFVRHATTQSVKETVVRTIQDFKRTHQDRWDEFKLHFSHDQLDDLQGAGAAHYFS